MKPSVGRIVHYVSYGTPGGEYESKCRSATVTEVGAWITVATEPQDSYSRAEGRPIRTAEQWYYSDAVALVVQNPTGLFFNTCLPDELPPADKILPGERTTHLGGTWHWPERVDD